MLSLFENQLIFETSFELAPSTTSDFRNIKLGNRDIMAILTSETLFKVESSKLDMNPYWSSVRCRLK